MKYYSTMKWRVHNETLIKTFQTVTTFRSYNLQMDNPHFFWYWWGKCNNKSPQSKRQKRKLWKYSYRMHTKSKEIVQPNAVYKTDAIKREFKNLIKYYQFCKLYKFILNWSKIVWMFLHLKGEIGAGRGWGWMIVVVKLSSFVKPLVFVKPQWWLRCFLLHCLWSIRYCWGVNWCQNKSVKNNPRSLFQPLLSHEHYLKIRYVQIQ